MDVHLRGGDQSACLPLCLCSGSLQTRLVKFSLQITNVCFIAFLWLSINEQTTYSYLYSNLNSKEILLILVYGGR